MFAEKKDWSATQYSLFLNERTRPVHDLINQVLPHLPPQSSTNAGPQRIYDLGCGPGNSTAALLQYYPTARITGMDSSPDMLSKARASLSAEKNSSVDFVQDDLSTFAFPESSSTNSNDDKGEIDLIISNAVFHWLRQPSRIPTLVKLFSSPGVKPGSVLAIQMPDNYTAPSHRLMRDTALMPNQPWSNYFSSNTTQIGNLSDHSRPDLDPIESPETYISALSELSSHVNVWRTEYMHILPNARAIVEWVKGTGLQPYLGMMEGDEDAKRGYLEEYERRLKGVYRELGDGSGRVVLGYPRLFVVAVRE